MIRVRGWPGAVFGVAGALVWSACERPAERAQNEQVEAPSPPDTVARIRAQAAAAESGYVVLDTARLDVTQDSVPDRIALSVQAERGAGGRVLWEDGHHWLLQVQSGARSYRLVDRFIPWGTVNYWIVESSEAAVSVVIAVESSTGGVRVEQYMYDQATATFVAHGGVRAEGRLTHRMNPEVLR